MSQPATMEDSLAALEGLRSVWDDLAAGTQNVFSTWEWADTWWRHFGSRRQLLLRTVDREGQAAAILPLCLEHRAGIKLARFVGHGVGDQLGPVCEPGDITIASRALAGLPQARLLLAERLPTGPDWARELGGRTVKTDQSPVIDLHQEGGWEQYLGSRSANFRQQVRRRGRRLEREHGVRFRLTEDPDRLDADLATLVELHLARWGKRSGAFSARRTAFHRDFARCAMERGWLRLWVAEAGGAPVAAWYGFRFAGVDCYYQAGRDPSWDRSGVGVGILEHTIRDAFEAGMREYRLLRGAESYKARYATRGDVLPTVMVGRGVGRRLLIASARRLVSLRRRLASG